MIYYSELVPLSALSLCLQSDPYWTVQTLTARERSRISNQTVCSLLEMLRLVARSNSSALINIRRPPPGHPHSQNWFMDTLWAVQKSGISQKRVRSSMLGMEALTQTPGTRGKFTLKMLT